MASAVLLQPYTDVAAESFSFWVKPVLRNSSGELYVPGFEGPTYVDNEWGYVTIGFPATPPLEQSKTPGLAEVDVHKFRDVDKKKAAGNDGARITVHGIEPALVTIRLLIWTPQQLYMLDRMWPLLFPVAGKSAPKAWDVDHPKLSRASVNSVVFTGGEWAGNGSVVNSRVFVMHAVEYLPPPKKTATKTPIGSTHSNVLDSALTPNTPGSNASNLGPPPRPTS